jgi:hypothetical protein
MRHSEMPALDWSDLDLQAGKISARRSFLTRSLSEGSILRA